MLPLNCHAFVEWWNYRQRWPPEHHAAVHPIIYESHHDNYIIWRRPLSATVVELRMVVVVEIVFIVEVIVLVLEQLLLGNLVVGLLFKVVSIGLCLNLLDELRHLLHGN